MAKGKIMEVSKKDGWVRKVHGISSFKPFFYKAEEWDKDAPTKILKTTGRQKRTQ